MAWTASPTIHSTYVRVGHLVTTEAKLSHVCETESSKLSLLDIGNHITLRIQLQVGSPRLEHTLCCIQCMLYICFHSKILLDLEALKCTYIVLCWSFPFARKKGIVPVGRLS